MTLAVISRPITDERGNLLEGAIVTIREGHDSGGDLAEIFSDSSGLNPIGNPVTVSDGNLLVYLAPGKYRLEGTSSGGSGTSFVDAISYNPKIDNFGGLTGGANQLPYFTGADSMGETALTAAGRAILGLSGASGAKIPVVTGAGAAALRDIVGTVSQSGEVPTGAVIQRGSNPNGEFVRFADGTQICWVSGLSVSGSGAPSWTYPAEFAAFPRSVAGNVQNATTPAVLTFGAAIGLNSAAVRVWNLSGSRVTENVSLIAVGRWF